MEASLFKIWEYFLFPLIASKVYSYPEHEAVQIAISAISKWLTTANNDMDIFLLVVDKTIINIPQTLRSKIDDFIDNHYIFKCDSKYKGFFGKLRANSDKFSAEEYEKRHSNEYYNESILLYYAPPSEERRKRDIEASLEESFSPVLMRLIVSKGKTPVEVYQKANIDRKLFSKIRNEKAYVPSKRTAIALAIALELSIDETTALLKRAGFALSRSLLFDVIIEYFIRNSIYDVYEINNVLFSYNLPTLGE